MQWPKGEGFGDEDADMGEDRSILGDGSDTDSEESNGFSDSKGEEEGGTVRDEIEAPRDGNQEGGMVGDEIEVSDEDNGEGGKHENEVGGAEDRDAEGERYEGEVGGAEEAEAEVKADKIWTTGIFGPVTTLM